MAKASAIQTKLRNELGTQSSKKCRRGGMLPGVVYGHKKDPVAVSVPQTEFMHLFRHGSHLFELQMPDHAETVLVKSVQYNYLGSEPLHVDFSRVDLNERVKVGVPLVLRGIPVGIAAGGVLQQIVMELQVECVVTDIPEQVRANVAKLELGQSIKANDLQLPEGAKLLTDPETVIAVVTQIKEEEVAPAAAGAEGAAEPEVIAKGKEKEEGEEGAEEEKKG